MKGYMMKFIVNEYGVLYFVTKFLHNLSVQFL